MKDKCLCKKLQHTLIDRKGQYKMSLKLKLGKIGYSSFYDFKKLTVCIVVLTLIKYTYYSANMKT